MSRPPVRIGVIGVGALGQHHARIYGELSSAELVGVFDADASRARDIATAHGCRAFSNMDELAAEIDAASVVVPTDLHFEVADGLLRRGLHRPIEHFIDNFIALSLAMVGNDFRGRAMRVGRADMHKVVESWVGAPPRFWRTLPAGISSLENIFPSLENIDEQGSCHLKFGEHFSPFGEHR